jgi:hypothetical protein
MITKIILARNRAFSLEHQNTSPVTLRGSLVIRRINAVFLFITSFWGWMTMAARLDAPARGARK